MNLFLTATILFATPLLGTIAVRSPMVQEHALCPGECVKGVIKVQNIGDGETEVSCYLVDAAGWAQLEKTAFIIPAHTSIDIPYYLKPPLSAAQSDYRCMLMVQVPVENPVEEQVVTFLRYGIELSGHVAVS